ncbi:hypothetical protein OF83DRAFT_501759 [Amylostereum chailletii]|nr:hypothetical protein OF83DRAFT_501759 [Amylostereum chailletii]
MAPQGPVLRRGVGRLLSLSFLFNLSHVLPSTDSRSFVSMSDHVILKYRKLPPEASRISSSWGRAAIRLAQGVDKDTQTFPIL